MLENFEKLVKELWTDILVMMLKHRPIEDILALLLDKDEHTVSWYLLGELPMDKIINYLGADEVLKYLERTGYRDGKY